MEEKKIGSQFKLQIENGISAWQGADFIKNQKALEWNSWLGWKKKQILTF